MSVMTRYTVAMGKNNLFTLAPVVNQIMRND